MLKHLSFAALSVAVLAAPAASFAQGSNSVRGYVRSDGTYVAPHYRSNPNSSTSDNYSTKGNYNPYTGRTGAQTDTKPSGYSTYTLPTYRAPASSSVFGATKPTRCSGLYC